MAKLSYNIGLLTRNINARLTNYAIVRAPSMVEHNTRVGIVNRTNRSYLSTFSSTASCDINRTLLKQTEIINRTQRRFKKRRGRVTKDEQEEEEEDDDDLANENPLLVEDIYGEVNDGCQSLTIDVNSLRLDSVCKTGFSVTRAKVEELFYKGDIYVNGERATKKSQDLFLNDEVDLVKNPNQDEPQMIDIKRLIIGELPDKANESGRLKIKIKRWNNLTVEPPGKRGSD